jgi:hypothetical protein
MQGDYRGPGYGKTFVMIVLAVQAMALGLCVMIICLLAKRADMLGGNYE